MNFVFLAPRVLAMLDKMVSWSGEDRIIDGREVKIWRPQSSLEASGNWSCARTWSTKHGYPPLTDAAKRRSSVRSSPTCTGSTSTPRRRSSGCRSERLGAALPSPSSARPASSAPCTSAPRRAGRGRGRRRRGVERRARAGSGGPAARPARVRLARGGDRRRRRRRRAHLHAQPPARPLADAALRAGKHVICEKPLARRRQAARVAAPPRGRGASPRCRRLPVPPDGLRGPGARGRRGVGSSACVHGAYLQDWLLDARRCSWRVDPTGRAVAYVRGHRLALVRPGRVHHGQRFARWRAPNLGRLWRGTAPRHRAVRDRPRGRPVRWWSATMATDRRHHCRRLAPLDGERDTRSTTWTRNGSGNGRSTWRSGPPGRPPCDWCTGGAPKGSAAAGARY